MKYIERIADKILVDKLSYAGGVQISGPKYCGKTETARRQAKSEVNMEIDPTVALAMDTDPNVLLVGDPPRLIDEWQQYPTIRNYVRHEIDKRKLAGQFILTGSATPSSTEESKLHSGAGRISRMRMRPMSWAELGWSDGSVSLDNILKGKKLANKLVNLPVHQIAKQIAIGGWPALVGDSELVALKKNRDYVDNIAEIDISRVAGVRRDPVRVKKVMESYARNIATAAKISTIASDVSGARQDDLIDRATISTYLNDLTRLMIVDDLPVWNTHIRSSAKLRVTLKRHFTDPSIAVAALNLSSELLVKELNYLGFLFESAAIHNLRVYADALDMEVYYYLDTDGDEVDAVIETRNGKFAAFEVKLGQGATEEAVASLMNFKAKLSDAKKKDLVSLNVVIGSGLSYTRPDGVNVVSLGALGV